MGAELNRTKCAHYVKLWGISTRRALIVLDDIRLICASAFWKIYFSEKAVALGKIVKILQKGY